MKSRFSENKDNLIHFFIFKKNYEKKIFYFILYIVKIDISFIFCVYFNKYVL